MDLNDRTKSVLKAIINNYISTAEPVGSRTVTKRYAIGVSPATVRNIMADLEEMGFLVQPHTSAGRVPTDKAYRFYIDTLLEFRGLSRQQEQRIMNYPLPKEDISQMMRETTRLLSSLSHFVGVVLAPKPAESVYRKIEFIRISGRRALAVFVSGTGNVHNRMIMLDEDISQAELDRASAHLNRELAGRTLIEVREKLVAMMKDDKDRYSRLMAKLMQAGREALDCEECGEEGLYIGNMSDMFAIPDFGDLDKIRELLAAFEEKHRLVSLLDKSIDADGVQVFIGSENPYADMQGVSLVAAKYKGKGGIVGTLGVIGPVRMPYQTVIPIVDCTAKMLGRLIDDI